MSLHNKAASKRKGGRNLSLQGEKLFLGEIPLTLTPTKTTRKLPLCLIGENWVAWLALRTLIGKWQQYWHDWLNNCYSLPGLGTSPFHRNQASVSKEEGKGLGCPGVCVESEVMEKPSDSFPAHAHF